MLLWFNNHLTPDEVSGMAPIYRTTGVACTGEEVEALAHGQTIDKGEAKVRVRICLTASAHVPIYSLILTLVFSPLFFPFSIFSSPSLLFFLLLSSSIFTPSFSLPSSLSLSHTHFDFFLFRHPLSLSLSFPPPIHPLWDTEHHKELRALQPPARRVLDIGEDSLREWAVVSHQVASVLPARVKVRLTSVS